MSQMFRDLRADEVECRVAQATEKGCSLLLYKTSRTDVALLDETVSPERWQCDYRQIGEMLFCGIGILFDGGWIWKWDTGTPSNMEADKGHASDALKRAGFRWGIGSELYTAPRIWVGSDACTVKQGRNGKWQCWDRFDVTEMEVVDGRITALSIANESRRGATVYQMPQKGRRGQQKAQGADNALQAAKKRMWAAIQRCAELWGRTPEDVLEGVRKRPDWAETAEFFDAVAAEFESECNG